ncbi:hypothetical protein CUB90_02945 [Clostridium sp. CT7]|nr:hypothetical protein CUB90_02945 [Clostridium sp. CT7]
MLAKRQTEVDFINGAVLREAKTIGIDVYVTRVIIH